MKAEFFDAFTEYKKRAARVLLSIKTELGNESENPEKRGFIKFGQPPYGFMGVYKIVRGFSIRSIVCLTFCFLFICLL